MSFKRSGGKKLSIEENQFDDLFDYFWFEALEAGSTVSFKRSSYLENGLPYLLKLYYSYDKKNWEEWEFNSHLTSSLTLENIGDRVYFYGSGAGRTAYSGNNGTAYYSSFRGTGSLACGGNILFLGEKHGNMTMPDYCFRGLFDGLTVLKDASELVLPDYVSPGCYNVMFKNCRSLISCPVLPATTLATSCYSNMFNGCTNLVEAPLLPAMELANYCYTYMFANISALGPITLPAEIVPYGAYSWMFNNTGFAELTHGQARPTIMAKDIKERGCYYMFSGSKLTMATLPQATSIDTEGLMCMFYACKNLESCDSDINATNIGPYGLSAMFQSCTSLVHGPDITNPDCTFTGTSGCLSMYKGCTALQKAPVIMTSNLGSGTCTQMFDGCSSLNEVTVYWQEWPGESVTKNWLRTVSAEGTFYKPNSLSSTYGASYIPSGWEIYNATSVSATL